MDGSTHLHAHTEADRSNVARQTREALTEQWYQQYALIQQQHMCLTRQAVTLQQQRICLERQAATLQQQRLWLEQHPVPFKQQ